MNVLNFGSEQCERIRRHLDAYLSSELLVETTNDVLRHLASCEACTCELQGRMRVRDALRRAAARQQPPAELRIAIQRQLREALPGFWGVTLRPSPVLGIVALTVLVVGIVAVQQWIRVSRGQRIVAGVLALGVSDHIQCAIKGHNYPEAANPPELLRKKLGPQYAGLLDIVQQKLPGFEVLEAHICSLPGSPRKYIHFITRGRGTILSVVLTRRDGEELPRAMSSATSAGNVGLYQAHLQGMNVAGFQSREYWGFVVSDLSQPTMLQIADELAPPLKSALDTGTRPEARAEPAHRAIGSRASRPA